MTIWETIAADANVGAERLVAEYGDRLLTSACRITQNHADAEDLVFRTFSQVIARIGQYSGRSDFLTWMYAILLNFRRMDLRRKSAQALVFTDNLPEQEDPAPDPAERFVLASEAVEVRKAIGKLPEPLREVIVLAYYEEMDVSTIAGLLKCPVGTVKSRLHRARSTLARHLAGTVFRDGASNDIGEEVEARKKN